MKIKVEGFNCELGVNEIDLPNPVESQYFEGTEESIEAELAVFGSRFKWYRVFVVEWDKS